MTIRDTARAAQVPVLQAPVLAQIGERLAEIRSLLEKYVIGSLPPKPRLGR